MTGSSVTVRALSKSFGDVGVLDGVDLSVGGGEFGAVLGRSGSGKTTLLRIIAGFERPDVGEVEINGTTLSAPGIHVSPEDRRVGIVPQDGALFPHLTVAGNIGFGLPGSVRRSATGRSRVSELMELVGLEGLGDRMPSELSGGQQQRVAVARCLAPKPDVVLLDEPFSALDATLRTSVRRDVAAALKSSGTTTILVTHDQEEALSMASTVILLEHGRVAQAADPATLYRFPANESVARFVGDAIVIPASFIDGRTESTLGILEVRSDRRPASGRSAQCRILLRPEQLRVEQVGRVDPEPADGSARSGPLGRVVDVEFHGHDALATIELDDGLVVRSRLSDPTQVRHDDRVEVTAHGDVVVFGDR